MGLFLKASSIALQEMPIVNASIEGTHHIPWLSRYWGSCFY